MKSTTAESRKQRERRRHRQEILAAALRLFSEKGFHEVSMQEIAAAAEFGTGTLYHFFSSKEDLFFELMVATAEASLGLVLPALEGPGDECQRVAQFIRRHARIAEEQGAAIRVYLLETRSRHRSPPRIEDKKKELHAQATARLVDVIAAGVRQGRFRHVDPVVAARCLTAALQSITLAAVEDPQGTDLPADLRKVEAVFFQGLVKSSGDKRDA